MSQFGASDALSSVDFISAKELLAYHSAGVESVLDLLMRLPKRYEDRRRFDQFPTQAGGGACCLRGTVIDTQVKRLGGRRQFYEAVLIESAEAALATSKITCRWFNMPWMKNMLAAGHEVVLYGKPKDHQGGIVIDHPDFEIVGDDQDSVHLERIVPIYKSVSGVAQRRQREHVYELLAGVDHASLAPIYDVDPSYPRHAPTNQCL